MLMETLIGYSLVALALSSHALQRLPSGPPRRGEYLYGGERFVLVAVALLASAAWALVLPLYAIGWFGSPRRRAVVARMGHFGAVVRSRLPLLRRSVRHPIH